MTKLYQSKTFLLISGERTQRSGLVLGICRIFAFCEWGLAWKKGLLERGLKKINVSTKVSAVSAAEAFLGGGELRGKFAGPAV